MGAHRYRSYLLLLIAALVFYTADRVTKHLAVQVLTEEPRVIIQDVLHLTFFANHGFLFGLEPSNGIIIAIVVVVMLILLGVLVKQFNAVQDKQVIFTLLVLLGAFSNLLDRIRFGYVIDFISIPFWSVFNFSDIYIVVGVLALLILMRTEKKESKEI